MKKYIDSFDDICNVVDFKRIPDDILNEINNIDICSDMCLSDIKNICDYRVYTAINNTLTHCGESDSISQDIIILLSIIFKGNRDSALIHLMLIFLYLDTINYVITFDVVLSDVFGYEMLTKSGIKLIKKYIKCGNINYYELYKPDYIQYKKEM